jgi:hypothetical protein
MKEIKSVGDNTIFEKKSGRYAVKDSNKKFINGDDKAKILADAGLITIPEPKAAPAEEVSEESEAAEEAAEE